MPFVHCEDCAHHVVVDPSGVCPEGHRTGVVTARTELGADPVRSDDNPTTPPPAPRRDNPTTPSFIDGGQVASAMAGRFEDPDVEEPEPWVGRVEPDAAPADHDEAPAVDHDQASAAATPSNQPLFGLTEPGRDADTEPLPAADREAMLRELQALGGFGMDQALGPEPAEATDRSSAPDLRLVPDPDPGAPAPPRHRRVANSNTVASFESMLTELANEASAPSSSPPIASGRPAAPRPNAPRSAAMPPPPPSAPPSARPGARRSATLTALPPPAPATHSPTERGEEEGVTPPPPLPAPEAETTKPTLTSHKAKRRLFGR